MTAESFKFAASVRIIGGLRTRLQTRRQQIKKRNTVKRYKAKALRVIPFDWKSKRYSKCDISSIVHVTVVNMIIIIIYRRWVSDQEPDIDIHRGRERRRYSTCQSSANESDRHGADDSDDVCHSKRRSQFIYFPSARARVCVFWSGHRETWGWGKKNQKVFILILFSCRRNLLIFLYHIYINVRRD